MLLPGRYVETRRHISYQQRCLALKACASLKETTYAITQFNHLIDADADLKLIEVEGQMTYGQLIRQLLPQHLLPMVIPTNKSTTIAESLTRVSVNAGAFTAGPVIESVVECDLWLPNGDIVTCRRDNDCQIW